MTSFNSIYKTTIYILIKTQKIMLIVALSIINIIFCVSIILKNRKVTFDSNILKNSSLYFFKLIFKVRFNINENNNKV